MQANSKALAFLLPMLPNSIETDQSDIISHYISLEAKPVHGVKKI